MKKKLLAILLALGLVITCMPMMAAFAATKINENPLSFTKGEGADEGKYILTFTVPKAIYNQKIYSYQFGFTFDKGAFEICERYDAVEEGYVTDLTHNFNSKLPPTITGRDTINKNGSVGISGAASESATFNKDISITMKFNKKAGADLDQASAFVINDYKIWSTDPEKPIACLTSDQDADTAAYTLDADRFAVAANSAEGTAAHTHTYGAPTYKWNYADPENVTCTASRKCETNPNHIETEEATVTSEVTQEATCMQKKETTYTATFENTAFEKQTKVVTGAIDPNNHDYTVTYAWDLSNQSGVTCTATRECKRNEAHDKKIEEAKEIKENIIGKATCTSTGKKTYTASFDSFAPSESEEVEIPATGHDFENSKDYLHDSTQHWKKCKNCDAGEENKKENHTGINKCDICGYEKTYTVTCNVMRYGVRDDVEITGYLCKKDGSYSDKITDDQFRKGDTGLQENEIKKVSTTGNEITFNGVTAGNYVLVILGDERTRSTRVAFVVDGDNISRQAKLYLFGDVNGDGDLTEEDVEKFMDVVVGNSICDDTIQAALGYRVQGRPKAVDITNARRIMGV